VVRPEPAGPRLTRQPDPAGPLGYWNETSSTRKLSVPAVVST
jgi:hypothetical protein